MSISSADEKDDDLTALTGAGDHSATTDGHGFHAECNRYPFPGNGCTSKLLIAFWVAASVLCVLAIAQTLIDGDQHGLGTACGYVRWPACTWMVLMLMLWATHAPPKFLFTVWAAMTMAFFVVAKMYEPSSAQKGCSKEAVFALVLGLYNMFSIGFVCVFTIAGRCSK